MKRKDLIFLEEMIYSSSDFIVIPRWVLAFFIGKRSYAIIAGFLLGEMFHSEVDKVSYSKDELSGLIGVSKRSITGFKEFLIKKPLFIVNCTKGEIDTYVINIDCLRKVKVDILAGLKADEDVN